VNEKSSSEERPLVGALTEEVSSGLKQSAKGLWYRLQESVIPDIRYLSEEEKQLEIRMAPYRRRVPLSLAIAFGVLGGMLLFPALLSLRLSWSFTVRLLLWGGEIFALWGLFAQLENLLLYEQWRFILTNKRIILVTPTPDRRGLADTIYLRQGQIKVIDTNWSAHPFWGLFQAMQGSRDVMLSMSGYEFKEEGAQVKGGLRFPDVRPEDIRRLEELIFG